MRFITPFQRHRKLADMKKIKNKNKKGTKKALFKNTKSSLIDYVDHVRRKNAFKYPQKRISITVLVRAPLQSIFTFWRRRQQKAVETFFQRTIVAAIWRNQSNSTDTDWQPFLGRDGRGGRGKGEGGH